MLTCHVAEFYTQEIGGPVAEDIELPALNLGPDLRRSGILGPESARDPICLARHQRPDFPRLFGQRSLRVEQM